MTHPFFAKAYKKTLVIPNKIVVQSRPDDSPSYQGEATDAESYALLPRTEYYQTYLTSNEQATKIAEAKLSKAQLWSDAGALNVPMNVGQETYDYIKATDSREGDTRTGNIGTLTRRYIATKNRWETSFSFGNWQTVRKALADLGITSDDLENYFSRLQVGDLYVENILAKNMDFVWIDPDNTIDLSQIGDNLDNLPDGEVYARVKTLHLDAGQIKLDENVLYSSGYDPTEKEAGIPKQGTPPSNPSVDDLWIDTSGTMNILKRWDGTQWLVSTPEDLDDLPDGTTYQRVKSAVLTAAGLVLLDQVVIGTYGLVKSTDIQSGHIKLSTAYGDLDDIDNGSTYEKLKDTDIRSGHIDLTSYVYAHGEWYNYSSIEIDADTGIKFFGNPALWYNASDAYRGCLAAEGNTFFIWSNYDLCLCTRDEGQDIIFDVDGDKGNYIVYPQTTNDIDLGSSAYYWYRVYAYIYYGKITSIGAFQDHDDIALLRAIKSKDGKLDVDTFPAEITETDEEMGKAHQDAVAKVDKHEQRVRDDVNNAKLEKQGEEAKEAVSQDEKGKKAIKVKNADFKVKQAEKAVARFDKKKKKVLKSLEETKNVRGVNMLGWQSLLMGSILQLAEKVDALAEKVNQ